MKVLPSRCARCARPFTVGAALALGLAGGGVLAQPAAVEQPRSIGHVLGDVLTQRVPLAPLTPLQAASAAASLPPGRIGLWLERRTPRTERDAAGRAWLVVDYQVVNAPQLPTRAALPALALPAGPGAPALAVPAWPIGIGPVTPPDVWAAGPVQALLPDRGVPPADTAPLRQRVQLAAGVLAATLLAWAGWWHWRNRRDRALPFERAWRQVARLDEADPAAWQALHRAIDATAGRVVHRSGVPHLLLLRPQLQPLGAALERFFALSNARFFHPATAPAAEPAALHGLARALRDAERRHAVGGPR